MKKANELCDGDVKSKKSSKAVDCIEKAYKQIEEQYSEEDTKQKFRDLVIRTRDCLKKQKEIYDAANKEVQKCPKKQ